MHAHVLPPLEIDLVASLTIIYAWHAAAMGASRSYLIILCMVA